MRFRSPTRKSHAGQRLGRFAPLSNRAGAIHATPWPRWGDSPQRPTKTTCPTEGYQISCVDFFAPKTCAVLAVIKSFFDVFNVFQVFHARPIYGGPPIWHARCIAEDRETRQRRRGQRAPSRYPPICASGFLLLVCFIRFAFDSLVFLRRHAHESQCDYFR